MRAEPLGQPEMWVARKSAGRARAQTRRPPPRPTGRAQALDWTWARHQTLTSARRRRGGRRWPRSARSPSGVWWCARWAAPSGGCARRRATATGTGPGSGPAAAALAAAPASRRRRRGRTAACQALTPAWTLTARAARARARARKCCAARSASRARCAARAAPACSASRAARLPAPA